MNFTEAVEAAMAPPTSIPVDVFDPHMSIYVPRVDLETTEKDVKYYFENWQLGLVSNVDFVQKMGQEYYQLYIHFENWFDTEKTREIQKKLNEKNQSVKMYYRVRGRGKGENSEYPFSWFLLKNTTKKYLPNERKTVIDLGDLIPEVSKPETKTITPTTALVSSDYLLSLKIANICMQQEITKLEQYWMMFVPPHEQENYCVHSSVMLFTNGMEYIHQYQSMFYPEVMDECIAAHLEVENAYLYEIIQNLKSEIHEENMDEEQADEVFYAINEARAEYMNAVPKTAPKTGKENRRFTKNNAKCVSVA